jgi:hypothetical protein
MNGPPSRPRSRASLPALLLTLASCTGSAKAAAAGPAPTPPRPHFALAKDLATFAVVGDLKRLQVIAGDMADAPDPAGLPAGSERYVEAIRSAARQAESDSTLSGATSAVATLGSACGACHAEHGVSPDAPGLQVAGLEVHGSATRHADYLRWVSRLLWRGLVAPSDDAWETGTGALAGADGLPAPHAAFVPADEVARDAQLVSRAAADAVVAGTAQERARFLSRIWGTCADCHVKASVDR